MESSVLPQETRLNTLALKISNLGDSALLLQCDGPMSVEVQSYIWAMDRACAALEGVLESVPGVHSLLVRLARTVDPSSFTLVLHRLWKDLEPDTLSSRVIEIEVDYGGRYGLDLERVAKLTGLSQEEVITRHTRADYVVFALGSQPGFAYLGGLDPSLATPRLDTPRISIPAGSVVIGGVQSGVISRTSPSGWNIIGHTHTAFFDPARQPPALLAPGDSLRFIAKENA